MADKKTTPALKISVSWTPDEATAKSLVLVLSRREEQDSADAVGKLRTANIAMTSGRLQLKAAIAVDYKKPNSIQRASERAGEIETALLAIGTVHSITVLPGNVPVAEAEVLPDPPTPQVQADKEEGEQQGGTGPSPKGRKATGA